MSSSCASLRSLAEETHMISETGLVCNENTGLEEPIARLEKRSGGRGADVVVSVPESKRWMYIFCASEERGS